MLQRTCETPVENVPLLWVFGANFIITCLVLTTNEQWESLSATALASVPAGSQFLAKYMFFTQQMAGLQSVVLLAQDGAAGTSGVGEMLVNFLVPMAVVLFMYYFMVVKPERDNRATHKDLLDNLKKNDHVVTAGGIHGTVVNADKSSDKIVIRIDENTNTKLHVNRTSIARVVTESDTSESTAS